MKYCLVLHKYQVSLDDPCCYPLGYMYACAWLKSQGHEVKVLNYNLYDYDFGKEIKDCDVVGFTGFYEFKDRILRDEKIAVELGKRTVVGGALSTFGKIDEFCGAKIIGEVDIEPDINALPYPDYEAFGIDEYHKRHAIRYMGVLTSRGCPYSCYFCAQTCKFRMRNLDNVFTEIDMYKKVYGVELIIFNDNTLNVNKSRFMRICEAMKSRGIAWSAAIRCQPFDEEMTIAAKNSGCVNFVVGVESLNQAKLNSVNKKMKVDWILRTLDLLNKHGIKYHGNILVGFEGETVQDIVAEIKSIPPQYSLIPAIVQPFIGTKCGYNRSINKIEYTTLVKMCSGYAQAYGKTYYPEDLEAA